MKQSHFHAQAGEKTNQKQTSWSASAQNIHFLLSVIIVSKKTKLKDLDMHSAENQCEH